MYRFFYYLILAAIFQSACQSSKELSQPNIIYILADDPGYGELGAYGQENIETPNINRLKQIFIDQHQTPEVATFLMSALENSGNQ